MPQPEHDSLDSSPGFVDPVPIPETPPPPAPVSDRAVIDYWAQFMRGTMPTFRSIKCDFVYIAGGPVSLHSVLANQVFT